MIRWTGAGVVDHHEGGAAVTGAARRQDLPLACSRRVVLGAMATGISALAAACAGVPGPGGLLGDAPPPAAQPPPNATAIGTGQVRVGLILPLSATGNA